MYDPFDVENKKRFAELLYDSPVVVFAWSLGWGIAVGFIWETGMEMARQARNI